MAVAATEAAVRQAGIGAIVHSGGRGGACDGEIQTLGGGGDPDGRGGKGGYGMPT